MFKAILHKLARIRCQIDPRWTVVLQRDTGIIDPITGRWYTEAPARAEAEEWGGVWSELRGIFVWSDWDRAWLYASERNDHMSLNSHATVVRVY